MPDIETAIDTVEVILNTAKATGCCYVFMNEENELRNVLECLYVLQKRGKPKSLTLDQLRRINGNPVYLVHSGDNIDDGFRICYGGYKSRSGRRYIMFCDDVEYDEECFVHGDVTAYCYKPKEQIE